MEKLNLREEKVFTVKRMTKIAILGAIAAFMSFTPFGYIQLGVVRVTFMHIPVIIAAIMEGAVGGVLVGLIFGVSSLVSNLSTPMAPVFLNPLVSILPRIMIGILAAWFYKKTKNVQLTAVVGTLTNTIGVLSMIYVFAAAAFANIKQVGISALGKILFAVGVQNGIFETIVAVIIVTAIIKAVERSKN